MGGNAVANMWKVQMRGKVDEKMRGMVQAIHVMYHIVFNLCLYWCAQGHEILNFFLPT